MPRVIVTRRLPEAALLSLREIASVVVWDSDEPMPRDALLASASADGGAQGLLCLLSDRIDAEVITACGSSLKVVSTLSVGYSHVDVPACVERGIRIGHTPDVLTEATADLTLALLLATARRVPEAAAAVRSGAWSSWKPFWMTGKRVHGTTVGIVGLGRIGVAVAQRLRGFACKILYTGRSGRKSAAEEAAAGDAVFAPLDELLAASDTVVVLCALTDATRGLLTYDRLARMRVDATLINVSRGEVVDQAALARLLEERPSFSAGLDVTTPEPLPTNSPLLQLPNCIVLPHIGSATTACRAEMCGVAAENVVRGLAGAPLVYEVVETRARKG